MSTLRVDQITDEEGTGAPDFPNGIEVAGGALAGLADQAEAEAGTDNTKLMTPLRTAQAIAELSPAPSELTQTQVEDSTSTVFGTVSGQRLAQAVAAAGGGFSNMQVFTSSGTFTVPDGVDLAYVVVVGGGGGGGTAASGPSTGGSGGAGGVAQGFVDLSNQTSVTVTVGAQGNGSDSSGNPAPSGGVSSFLGFSANGGQGGNMGIGSIEPPGNGGSATAPGGLAIPGRPGFVGVAANTTNGTVSGVGGSSPYGSGGRGAVGNSNGFNATGFGSGGSGGAAFSFSPLRTGGAGSPGLVVVYY